MQAIRLRLAVASTLTAGSLLVSGCTEAPPPATEAGSSTTPWEFEGPSGLELESEQAARDNVEAQRLAAEEAKRKAEAAAAAAEAAEAAAAEAAAEAAAAEAAAAAAAEAAAAEAAKAAAAEAEAAAAGEEECIGYGCSPEQDAEINDLERRCSDGTATVEECFGPGADANGNGIADVNE